MLGGIGGFKELGEKMQDVYSLLTNDPERHRKHMRRHREKGALRSG